MPEPTEMMYCMNELSFRLAPDLPACNKGKRHIIDCDKVRTETANSVRCLVSLYLYTSHEF